MTFKKENCWLPSLLEGSLMAVFSMLSHLFGLERFHGSQPFSRRSKLFTKIPGFQNGIGLGEGECCLLFWHLSDMYNVKPHTYYKIIKTHYSQC